MPLILSHVMSLRLVRRVRRRIGWAGGRNGGIYRNVRVRLHVGLIAMVWLPIMEGVVDERTCGLRHTCRAAGLGVGRVLVVGRRAGEVFGVGRAGGGGGVVQTVVRLRGVGGRDVGGGADVGLGGVLTSRTDVGLSVLSRGSRGRLVCRRILRMSVAGRLLRRRLRTWLCAGIH